MIFISFLLSQFVVELVHIIFHNKYYMMVTIIQKDKHLNGISALHVLLLLGNPQYRNTRFFSVVTLTVTYIISIHSTSLLLINIFSNQIWTVRYVIINVQIISNGVVIGIMKNDSWNCEIKTGIAEA